jgi:hypothetical protein
LKVPLVNKQLAQEAIKGRWCEIWQIIELGEHIDAFFHNQLLKIEAAMAFWATA